MIPIINIDATQVAAKALRKFHSLHRAYRGVSGLLGKLKSFET